MTALLQKISKYHIERDEKIFRIPFEIFSQAYIQGFDIVSQKNIFKKTDMRYEFFEWPSLHFDANQNIDNFLATQHTTKIFNFMTQPLGMLRIPQWG